MACVVESEDDTDPTQEKVTFMYKYAEGPCPKSYGFNAAKLAGIPQQIIRRAFQVNLHTYLIILLQNSYMFYFNFSYQRRLS